MKKIFILDDNEEFLDMIRLILGNDYELRTTSHTRDIATSLIEFDPDLFIIDLLVGNESAKTVLEDIRLAIPGFKVPVILFSGWHDLAQKVEETGANGYIEKPSSIHYIRSYIKDMLEKDPGGKK